jgi:XRE family transcriptional regulator, aerobic/anaerobic benzoate catabolism transcriptional regulator
LNAPPDSIAATDQALLDRIAGRVRSGRKEQGLSRRALSSASGVSERYLAELEAGRGNISVLLLARIATALDQPIEALIADVSEPDALELAARVGEAPPAQQDAIRRMLDANRPATPIQAGRICLIGLRGAGKSTLGQLAAEALDAPFVELSDEIETHAGLPVAEVMALYGQEGYRQLERQAIARVRDRYDRVILAVAGGIVSESETYGLLLRHFHSIWLKAAPDDHMNRVLAQGDQRPIKGRPRPMDELNAILERRHTLYAKAEAAVETSGKSVKDAAAEVVRAVQSLTA